jgi:uncharacterized cupin superfamily protein
MSSTNELFKSIVANVSDIEKGDVSHYPGDDELMSLSASFAHHFKLTRLGIHHERLTPGRRVSWPHAEADEEEFVYVIEGTPDLWLDGHLHRLKPGDGVAFASGTGIAHTIINNTKTDVRLIVVGEPSRFQARIHYPLHPKRNAEIAERHWKDVPIRELGPHDGRPDALK